MALPLTVVSQGLANECTAFPLLVHQSSKVKLFRFPTIKIFDVTLDNHLTLKQHTQSLCRNIHFHTRALRRIRPALTDSMAATVATSVVQSRLDYANALLHGTLAGNIYKLQCAQKSLSCVALPHHPGSASSRLSHFHWLPVHRWIQYKIALLTIHTRVCQPTSHHTSEIFFTCTNHRIVSAQPVKITYLFPSALLISVNVLSVLPLLQFGMNCLPLSGSQTPWTPLNAD